MSGNPFLQIKNNQWLFRSFHWSFRSWFVHLFSMREKWCNNFHFHIISFIWNSSRISVTELKTLNQRKSTTMIPSCSFERKFLIELYVDTLLLIQVVLSCVFINEKANVDHYITLGPLVYLLYACLNLLLSYSVLRPHRQRMKILRDAIIARIIGLLGNE